MVKITRMNMNGPCGFSCEMDNSQPSPKGRYARPTDAVQRLNVGGLETIRSRP